MYLGRPDQQLQRKSRRSKYKVRSTDREREEDLIQESLSQPRRSRMASMTFDDEIEIRSPASSVSSTSSAERMQVEWKDIQESDQSDDAPGEDVEITEGGWICRVERFQKLVDSRGKIHLRKKRSSPIWDPKLAYARKPEGSDPDQVEKNIQRSIISCVHYTSKRHAGFIESETYIEIKSPLILEVLRKNTSYGQQV